MAGQRSSPPFDPSISDPNIRKRVCKACDRCRLKKSKCDGTSPCGRCKTDNAICVFGERKKAHDKVYPKGYVEMLEQQQNQLVSGLRELYKLAVGHEAWPGKPLKELPSGYPLTHDMLHRLGALKQENNSGDDFFEDDLDQARQRLMAKGGDVMRRDSTDISSAGATSPASTSNRMSTGDLFSADTFLPTPPEPNHFAQSHTGRVQPPQPRASTTQIQPQDSPRQRHTEQQNSQQQQPAFTSTIDQPALTSSLGQPHFHFPTPGTIKPEISSLSNYPWPRLGGDEMDMTLESLRNFDSFDSVDGVESVDYLQMASTHVPRPSTNNNDLSSCLPPQPDWTDDEFNYFLNSNPNPNGR